mmetsp:Transcript_22855/g.68339  ORF Transcript_22855/g.68339 Transcript_22855/m.68339 type:complete len:185 (-) Transcript_22855:9-563(-)
MAAETSCPFKEQQYGLGTHTTKKGTKVTIRLATEADVGTIRKLIVGLALYEKEPEETVEVTEDELRRDGFGAQPVFRCLLAEVEGVAIGFALFFYNYSTWQGRCIYLEDLYVDESARGTGTGTLLLKTVAAIAHVEGCKRMSWQALDWNTPALDFYKALGANRLDSWVNLRLGEKELTQLLGIS